MPKAKGKKEELRARVEKTLLDEMDEYIDAQREAGNETDRSKLTRLALRAFIRSAGGAPIVTPTVVDPINLEMNRTERKKAASGRTQKPTHPK